MHEPPFDVGTVHIVPLFVLIFLYNHPSFVTAFFNSVIFSYLYCFPPQNEEVLCPHHHEAHELVAKDLLNLISLQGRRFLLLHVRLSNKIRKCAQPLDKNSINVAVIKSPA